MGAALYIAIPIMALLAVIQTAVLPHFAIAGTEPQLLFLVALAWGLVRGLEEGVILAFVAGLWVDLFSVAPMGLSSLAFMAGVAAPVALQQVMPPRRLLVATLMAIVGTLIYLTLYVFGLGLFGHGISLTGLAGLLPIVIMHAVLIGPIFLLLRSIARVMQPRRVEF